MNTEEYERLEQIDQRHWFYRAKRAVVKHWLDRYLTLAPDDLIIDAGMGTGTWLMEMSSRCRVLGLDNHDESMALARPKVEKVNGRIVKADLNQVGLADGSAAVVTLLDVLEHIDDDVGALRQMIRITKPGGLVLITVPAHQWLWSDWDVALHHRRRYSRAQLIRLVDQPGVELLRCAYFNTFLLPLIGLARTWRRLRGPAANGQRAEDIIPPAAMNALLYWVTAAPACWSLFRPPLGVSLLAVLRRKS